MALSSCLLSFIVSHLLIIFFVLGENYKSEAKCSESFECGSLGEMRFPFFKSTEHADCGLYKVNCDAEPHPKIKLSPEGCDDEYNVMGLARVNITTNTIRVRWLDKTSCCNFIDLSLLNTSLISFTVSPNITLFKCHDIDPTSGDPFPGYHKFHRCEHQHGFTVYFKNPDDTSTSSAPGPLPHCCSTVQLPLAPQCPHSRHDLSDLLADEFEIKWNVSADCRHRRCLIERNQVGSSGGSDCGSPAPSNAAQPDSGHGSTWKTHKLGLILGTAGVALILIICIVTFIIWRRRRTNSPYIVARIKSSAPFSRRDVEASSMYSGVSVFTYQELEEATNGFDSSKELGDGGFGIVYYGKLRDRREVAVKRLYEHNFKRLEQFMNEIRILTCLRHPNLVSLYGCTSRHSRELLLVYEYVPNGTVADHLHGDRQEERLLSWPIRMNIAIETASALAYLHASDIIHRDVKTNNILLDQHLCVKVADFGLSRLFPNGVSHVSTAPQGTPGYVDPEYRECYQLTDKSDVYSFGVILIELISSLPAVDISRHRQEINLANLAIDRIQRCAYDELVDLSLGYATDPEVKRMITAIAELAFRCLQVDKELRPAMDEVLKALEDIKENK